MKRRKQLLLLVLCFSAFTSIGQISSVDSARIETLISEGNNFIYTSQFDSSRAKLREAQELCVSLESWHQYYMAEMKLSEIEWRQDRFDEGMKISRKALRNVERDQSSDHILTASLNQQIGTIHLLTGDTDSTLIYFDRAAKLAPDTKGGWVIRAAIYVNMANLYNRRGEVNKQISFSKLAYDMDKKIYSGDHVYLAEDLLAIAGGFNYMSMPREALKYLIEAENVLKRLKRSGEVYTLVSLALGESYLQTDQYDKAFEYLNQALKNDIRLNGESHISNTSTYSSLGKTFAERGLLDSGIYYLEKGLEFEAELMDQRQFKIITAKRDLATSYARVGDLKSAEYQLYGALNYAKNELQSVEGEGIILHDIGYANWIANEFEKAEEFYLKSIEVFRSGEDLSTLEAISHENLGTLYKDWGKPMKALESYQHGLSVTAPGWEHESILENPGIDQTLELNSLFNILLNKAEIFSALYVDADTPLDTLKNVSKTFELLDEIIQNQRSSITRRTDKIDLLGHAHDTYERAIQLNWLMYQRTNDSKFIEKCFYYSEADKSTLLSESTNYVDQNQVAEVPSDLLRIEEELKVEQSYLRSELTALKSGATDGQEGIEKKERQLVSLNQSLDSLNNQIREKHPDFFELKYKREILSVEVVQDKIPSSSTFIEYFMGDSLSYAMILSEDALGAVELGSSTELRKLIKDFQESVKRADMYTAGDMLIPSRQLYQKLLQPFEDIFADSEKLIVAPGGELGTIPFDLLLTEDLKAQQSILEMPFLVRKLSAQNVYSASTVFSRPKNDASTNNGLVCFAPSYESPDLIEIGKFRNSISELIWNHAEIEKVRKIAASTNFSGDLATEAKFKTIANGNSVIHLAMHAFIDDEDPMNSKLVFSNVKDSIEDNLLHTFELFNMKLNADLAVLSACETGSGKLIKGDGIMSLASGFAYAGVPSVVMSHWQVDDQSTSALMGYFYEFLAKGLSKSESLRQAKLKYLETANPEKTHPFFWGSFVVIGDDSPVFRKSYSEYYITLAIALLLLVAVVGISRKRRTR